MQHQLLGFDVRIALSSYAKEAWNMDRRSMYLLRENIEKPLSVDRTVWPSLDENNRAVDEIKRITSLESGVPQEVVYMYKNLDEATTNLSLIKDQQMNGIVIAIEVLYDHVLDTENWYLLSEPATPDKLPDCWKFIGYDIADQSFISGLSNCGYTEEEKLALKNPWGDRLNQHGLFNSMDDAVQFRNLTDDRVPEHRPFRVYRISHSPDQPL